MLNVQDREQVQRYSWNKVATITFNFTDNFKLQGRLEAMEKYFASFLPIKILSIFHWEIVTGKYASSSTAVTP